MAYPLLLISTRMWRKNLYPDDNFRKLTIILWYYITFVFPFESVYLWDSFLIPTFPIDNPVEVPLSTLIWDLTQRL